MELIITDHAALRIKERVGIKNAKGKEALAMAAYTEGMRLGECDRLSEIELMAHNKYEFREVVMYRDQLFIFDGNVLITVLPVNQDYRRIMESKRARMNRNGCRYTA